MAIEVTVQEVKNSIIITEAQNGVVTIDQKEVVATVEKEVQVVTVAAQGPPGAPGLPGSSASGETVEASGPLSGHRALTLNASEQAVYASADNPSHIGRVIGIGTNAAAAAGTQIAVKTQGIIEEAGWAWTPNALIYLGISGNLTQTPPLPGVGFLQILGHAISPTSMMVRLQTPIRR